MFNQRKTFNIHMISDATGETLLSNARAVIAQYPEKNAIEHLYVMIRKEQQLTEIFDKINKNPGIVLYTILDPTLAEIINNFCKKIKVPCVGILQPLLLAFQYYLDKPNVLKASAQHALDENYFKRIAALDFTMAHDDGMGLDSINGADIILIGISRTSKTPTSIYLANKGYKTANIPLVSKIKLPIELDKLKGPLIVGLVATANRISQIRQNRLAKADFYNEEYISQYSIAEELIFARRIFEKYNWPIIDVTRKSVEEIAANIVNLFNKHIDGN
ncbi:pyruvate, water dikinase regulatory protein [Bartonella sp. DGB1]|uniref:pyruvate, water dikinase regulatory protein n=1 Tax=Bartonella sp. DGB1 TaxID=3239807 RepID=UPI003524CCBA